jgi:hypothetical protein
MRIDQRNAGAAFGTSNNGYTVDRWRVNQSPSTGKLNGGRNYNSVTPPTGFTNYLGVQSQSAYAVSSNDFYTVSQLVEGFNIADLAWGTANAKTVTLSFQVYSSLTGTFGGAIRNGAGNRAYPFTYTISSANTWTQISITIAGDTTGTWSTDNSTGLELWFSLGVGPTLSGTAGSWSANGYVSATGATSVVGTNGATFYITGVQLEQNTSATPFERRLYNQELANCQRYYIKITDPGATGVASGSISARNSFFLPVTMRAAPTVLASGTFNFYNGGGTATGTVNSYYPGISAQIVQVDFNLSASYTTGQALTLFTNGGSNFVSASAEI